MQLQLTSVGDEIAKTIKTVIEAVAQPKIEVLYAIDLVIWKLDQGEEPVWKEEFDVGQVNEARMGIVVAVRMALQNVMRSMVAEQRADGCMEEIERVQKAVASVLLVRLGPVGRWENQEDAVVESKG